MAFPNALRAALREDPDVILVGEMRDLETIKLAITAAETGHLVFGTLHTTDAVQTVDRVIDVFPTHQQQQVRMQMSVNLLGVISQILVKRADGMGRVAAYETLVAIPAVRNLIREGKTHQIGSLIQTMQRHGMQTLDQSLAHLVHSRQVTYDDALAKAGNIAEFKALVGTPPKL
jgi:twitching motility protein PilT